MEDEYLDIEKGVVKGFMQGAERDTVEIPNGVTEIGEGAFRGCTVLKSIEIPASVIKIGDGAFMGCTSLETVTIPNSVTEIGDWTFAFCTSLHCITIPKSVQSISKKAFSGCYRFIVHYAGAKEEWCNIKGIADNQDLLFHTHVHCLDGIVKVKVDNDLVVYGSVLVERLLCSSSKVIQIPQCITRINQLAFYGCHRHMTIKIPNSVTKIGKDAFGYCPNLMIQYDGVKAQWGAIGGNDCGLPQGATVQCTDGNITI